MCGRYTFCLSTDETADVYSRYLGREIEVDDTVSPTYNAAPRDNLPVIKDESDSTVTTLNWGLVPRWADTRDKAFINARSETADRKPSFADSFESRRCLVLADGFYEWNVGDNDENEKQPYRFTLEDEEPFAFAGLWDVWEDENQAQLGDFGVKNYASNRTLETFTILTAESNSVVEELHDRMAVVLKPDEMDTWLHAPVDEAKRLLKPYEGAMRRYRVSEEVNSPVNDYPELINKY
ncbi:MAG: SOS response-associated peptidase [Halobacteria archaeon]|nr:SOS response-associated peptidase [Halobacteria archaeon]